MAVASRVRPSAGVSLPQMMSILLAGNAGAFANGNPNALRTGATLKVPTAQALGVQGAPTSPPSTPEVAATTSPAPGPSVTVPPSLPALPPVAVPPLAVAPPPVAVSPPWRFPAGRGFPRRWRFPRRSRFPPWRYHPRRRPLRYYRRPSNHGKSFPKPVFLGRKHRPRPPPPPRRRRKPAARRRSAEAGAGPPGCSS